MPDRIGMPSKPVAKSMAGVSLASVDHVSAEKEQIGALRASRDIRDPVGRQSRCLDLRECAGQGLSKRILDIDFVFAIARQIRADTRRGLFYAARRRTGSTAVVGFSFSASHRPAASPNCTGTALPSPRILSVQERQNP